jgi:hypothetical protein
MIATLGEPAPPSLLRMCFGDGTPLRALATAAVVGTLLIMINHGDLMIEGDLPPLTKVALTYCVPYLVTTWGAVTGKRAQWRRDRSRGDAR